MDRVKQSEVNVSQELADTIKKLDYLLSEQFGCDCAYTIMGKGEIVAASNKLHGEIVPAT